MLRTKSFELATYSSGDKNSSKLALLLPGRLDTKDYAHLRSHVDFLGSRGFYALSFDPPGTWESPGDISLYTVQNYLSAIDELIDFFGNKPTILMGHSRGGSVAMLGGIRNNLVTHIIAVMSHYGPSEMSEGVKEKGYSDSSRDLPPGTEQTEKKKTFRLPLAYFENDAEYTHLETCLKPKLFFYGTEDTIVTSEDVKESYNLAAEPKQIHALEARHDYRLQPEIIKEINEVTANFLGLN